MIFIDSKYLNMLSIQLNRFKKTDVDTWNFRCPFCGDSKKSSTKARGWIYPKNDMLKYKCFNCDKRLGRGNSFHVFIRELDPSLYKKYIFEKMRESASENVGLIEPEEPLEETLSHFSSDPATIFRTSNYCPDLTTLPADHPAVQYIQKRKIPSNMLSRIGFTYNYKAYINKFVPDKYKLFYDYPALIFHLKTESGQLTGIQGRNIDPEASDIRYQTSTIDKALADVHGRIFGAEHININETVFVLEGPIDSLFLDNAVAVCGSDMFRAVYPDAVYILDNEPDNKQIRAKYLKLIKAGRSVVILPVKYMSLDINDIVLKYEMNKSELHALIKKYTFSGLRANIEYQNWK